MPFADTLMFGPFRKLLSRLCSHKSGNATMIVALGLPALIGGTGFAVDTAQWYMWKREMQYAVDQAAVAGAWARSKDATKDTFVERARQEFASNISTTEGFSTRPYVALSNYAAGADNSVIVSASATKQLPFSGLLTGHATTVSVFAQASFEAGWTFTSCLVATDPDDDGAITIGGSSVLTASCGIAALSDSEEAIIVNGSPDIDAGWILAAGGIDPWLEENTDDIVMAHLDGLYDPFAELNPPNPPSAQVSRTYSCVKGAKTTRANVADTATTSYTYWKGADYATAVATNYNKAINPTTSTTSQTYTIVSNETIDGTVYTTTVEWTAVNGSAKNTVWEKKTTVTATTYSNTTSTTAPDQANTFPGTYSGIDIACSTVFAPGIYVINGGVLNINAQYVVSGSGVMFVLKNGAGIRINGGANINLTAMTASELMAQGVSSTVAQKLQGMLIFEDRNSSGDTHNIINGNASTVLNGTVYLPASGLTFSGTASVTSQCLMVVANTIYITGDANMSTFCPAGSTEDTTVATTASRVRLVS